MGTIIVKAERDSDLYMAWSTVTDGPVASGTRAEITEWLRYFGPDTSDPEERLARADETGTSGTFPGAGQWDDRGFVCAWDHTGNHETGLRWLPRRNIAAWLRTGDESLLEPIEAEVGVGDAVTQALMAEVDRWLAKDTPGPLSLDLHDLERRLSEVVAPLEAIVRDLAARDAPRHGRFCGLCEGYTPSEPHSPACPWRRATEWRDQETTG